MSPKKRILVVDDEVTVISVLQMNLEAEGYRVSVAYDGMEALTRIQAEPPDLVICDIMMPEMNGLELCRMIREDTSMNALPFIFLTAKDEMPERIGGLNAGADDYLTKPFNMDELIARVHAILRRVDRVRENSVDIFRHASRDLNRLSSLGVLAASIAHEIRNQLTMVLTSAEILRYETEEPKRDEYTDVVVEQLDRINHTIISMLDFARRQKPSYTAQSIYDIIEEALELTQPKVDAQKTTVTSDLPDTLPTLLVDRQPICQVLINLIINATQAIEPGGRITVRAKETDGHVDIQIEDDGCGIAAADMETIFQPFVTTRSGSDGIGLGLFISKQIIEAHQGALMVKSEQGQGTCFTIRLPMLSSGNRTDANGVASTQNASSSE